MNSVPLIDLNPYRDGSAEGRKEFAKAVDEACRNIGFLVIKGHGIPSEFIDDLFAEARAFYDLDVEQKMQSVAEGVILRGYAPMKTQNLAKSRGEKTPPDLRESYVMGRPELTGQEHIEEPAANAFYQPNVWPEKPSAFEAMYTDYYRRMEGLTSELMGLFANALGVQEDYFADKIDDHFGILNSIHYPELDSEPEPGQLRAGAHTDFGSLTILTQTSSSGGLEVMEKNGAWTAIPRIPGAFIINIGDLMAQWTNDRWVSTLHRVANPHGSLAMQRRQSLAFFCHPNYDAMVECIPTCAGAGNEARYKPIRAGDYMRQKIQAVRGIEQEQPSEAAE